MIMKVVRVRPSHLDEPESDRSFGLVPFGILSSVLLVRFWQHIAQKDTPSRRMHACRVGYSASKSEWFERPAAQHIVSGLREHLLRPGFVHQLRIKLGGDSHRPLRGSSVHSQVNT